jgi:hypothetical protein
MEVNMTDRFELEQKIMECWNITSDINSLIEGISDKNLSNDEIVNILLGIKGLYDLKFDQMFYIFETLIKEKKIL